MNFLRKKIRYHFYLPSEIFYKINQLNEDKLMAFINSKKLNFLNLNIEKLSEYLYLITIQFQNEIDLSEFKSFISTCKELLPPWLTFPEMFQGAPRWSQGYQEDYCIGHWLPYWKDLSFSEKDEYMKKYLCPTEWKIWLSENDNNL